MKGIIQGLSTKLEKYMKVDVGDKEVINTRTEA